MLIKISELTEGSIVFSEILGYLLIVKITEIEIVFCYLSYKPTGPVVTSILRTEEETFAYYDPKKSLIFPKKNTNKQYETI